MAITYKDAGVDIDAGARLVDEIAPLAKSTMRPEVLSGLGGFAGLCRLPTGYREPILVSGTDGVGTKLKSALATGRHQTIGIDLVAMSVNDVLVTGAEPLFFLDYYATGRLDVDVARTVIAGIAEGCRQAGCALIGGETAEMPGVYHGDDYDLAGFCVGVVERSEIRTGDALAVGDALVGLPSAGLHANGHSLARKVLLDRFGYDDAPPELGGATVADELLRPTLIYAPAFAALRQAGVRFLGAAHITGGGLIENPPRMLATAAGAEREDLALVLDPHTWDAPAVMALIAAAGVEEAEMRRTFNMGIGMVLALRPDEVERGLAAMAATTGPGLAARVIGRIEDRGAGPAVRFAS
jgi:phosphoribosylformylglycinamidine cyclo-ligase